MFVLNPEAKNEDLRTELIDLIYSLNSICIITYDLLLDEINDHLLNTFSVLVRSARKMVYIVEQLNFTHEVSIF
ncbi:MAG: hypothetical protein K2Q14_03730 [Gammaproteobacteria bacterium]|nr:hypothetical protein [Gammaproteobacteria bacterium]